MAQKIGTKETRLREMKAEKSERGKRGPGRPKIEGTRPWEAAGMSKRSWYRKKAEGKL